MEVRQDGYLVQVRLRGGLAARCSDDTIAALPLGACLAVRQDAGRMVRRVAASRADIFGSWMVLHQDAALPVRTDAAACPAAE